MPGAPRDTLRRHHERAVVEALQASGSASRADLMQATGLSRATVFSITADLQRRGLLAQTGSRPAGGRGRPQTLLGLVPPPGLALAVDVGFAHVRVVVADRAGDILVDLTTDFDDRPSSVHLLEAGAALVARAVAAVPAGPPVVAAAVGLPSPVDLSGRVLARHFKGVDPVRVLGLDQYADQVQVRNDAYLGAVGEAAYGAGRDIADFVYVKLSRGLGSGLVLAGRPYRGAGLAGNLGHVRVREGGDVCLCGNRGCLETLVSADSLLRALRPAHPGEVLTTRDLVRLCAEADPGACALVSDAGRVIGQTLAQLVTVLHPSAVMVGGALSALGDTLLAGIQESITRYGQPSATHALAVRRAALGAHAEVLGGVAVAFGYDAAPTAPAGRTAVPG